MSEIKVDTVAEKTSANGVTVDGLNIKDSKLVTANSVITSNVTDANITLAKLAGDSVDGTKIADNAINSEHYTDASIDAAHLNADVITGHTAETSIADADTLLIHDASASALRKMTKANFVSGVGGDNTPSFGATMSADQNNLSSGVFTLAAFNTEVWDTDNAYTNTSSNYKFTVPSGEAGKYFITAHLMFRVDSSYQSKELRLNKNGSFLVENCHHLSTNEWRHNYSNNISITTVQNLSVGDYIQVYGKAVGNTWDMKQEGAYFSMHKLIGV